MKRPIFPRSAAVLIVGLALCSPLLNGCGGSGHGGALSTTASGPASAHAAQATVTIKWPAQPIVTGIAPRLIPLASNSVTVTITQGSHTVAAHLFTRPGADQPLTSTYTFGNTDALPIGSLIATAKAFPSVDGKGTAQSGGSRDFVTTLGANAPININMGTTIVNLVITPSSPTVGVGVTTQMMATAVDATGAMVLTTASKVQWSSSAPAIASVDPNTGVVTSIALGNAILTATDSETGQSGLTSLLVLDGGGSGGGGGAGGGGGGGTGGGGGATAYTITDLGTLPQNTSSSAHGMNNSGQIVGHSETFNNGVGTIFPHAFLYRNDQMKDIGTLPDADSSIARAINDAGQVVGVSQKFAGNLSNGFAHGFLYSNNQMQDIGTLPSDDASIAVAINDAGQVVGDSQKFAGNVSHAFLYSNGQMKDLGTLPGADTSYATGINSAGLVVGTSHYHAFLYSNGQMKDLGTLPGDDISEAVGINSSGQVVGESFDTNAQGLPHLHVFLYSNGQMQNLGTLQGDDASTAQAINDAGQIVGYSTKFPGNVSHAFVYSNSLMQDLQMLLPANSGWTLVEATGINANGQICGNGTINGQSHAFLLTPVGLTAQRRH